MTFPWYYCTLSFSFSGSVSGRRSVISQLYFLTFKNSFLESDGSILHFQYYEWTELQVQAVKFMYSFAVKRLSGMSVLITWGHYKTTLLQQMVTEEPAFHLIEDAH